MRPKPRRQNFGHFGPEHPWYELLSEKQKRRLKRRWSLPRRLITSFLFVALVAVCLTTWLNVRANFKTIAQFENHSGEIHQALAQNNGTAFIAAILSMIVAFIVALGLTRQLMKPLAILANGAKRLADGERNFRLKSPRTFDEVQTLTESFNNLATNLKQQEEWRQNMVADIAHDLRTPLAVMRSEVEAMQDGVRPLDQQGLQRLQDEILLLTRLVDDLRFLFTAEQGQLRLNLTNIELQPFLQNIIDAFQRQNEQIKFEIKCSPDLKAKFDPIQITRVLNNLIENAIQHAKPNKIEIGVSKEKNGLQIWIADDGSGLPKDAVNRIFERFYRIDSARTRNEASSRHSGLGLSIAQAIIKAHHGQIKAENLEKGTKFTIYLPLT